MPYRVCCVRDGVRPVFWFCVLWLAGVVSHSAAVSFDGAVLPLLQKYCYDCHDDTTQKGGVNLAAFTNAASLQRDPKLWENVERQVRDRAMPPARKAQPEPAELLRLLDGLVEALAHPDPRWVPVDPGATRPRRLSRTEYNRTVHDLLGVTNAPANSFPPDGGGGGGFDNNADTLFLPPVLLERYLAAAEDVLAEAREDRLLRFPPAWYRPDASTAARNLRWFLRRAWRRPATDAEVARFLGPYTAGRAAGQAFLPALKASYRAALVSPHFLYRAEPVPSPGAPGDRGFPRVDDFALASRLSYFLWSSCPDDALLDAAAAGRLRDARGLSREARRMLADPRARALSEQFAGQWLGTRHLTVKATPDAQRFPTYTPELAAAMMREPVEFFAALLRDDDSLLRLLDADFTYVNRALAQHYGLTNAWAGPSAGASAGASSGAADDAFVRVALPDRTRGGVVTMAAVLTLTSYPRRTSPVLRGKWLLEEVLGTPAPPPPPLVATLPSDDRVQDNLTFRQRLEKHREKAACAGCHNRLDPPGFALEQFDSIGAWRREIDGRPVDARGVLVSGEVMDGVVALKDALLARRELFVRHLTEKLLAYALGRGLESYDIPVAREIQRQTAAADHRMEAWVLAVVNSFPFTHQRPAPRPSTSASSGAGN